MNFNLKKAFRFAVFPLFWIAFSAFAQSSEADSVDYWLHLDELVVYPRENQPLRRQPVSYSHFDISSIAQSDIASMSDLSAVAPNFYMPKYGSKITSSVFLRGIGARMNEPSVGLYVDNIPYLEKSAFDFSFYDLSSIEVLRGPQGTLYGRNCIGGIVRIATLSPFDYQGVRAKISYGSYNDAEANVSYYHKWNDKWAASVAAFGNGNSGFFRNELTGEKNAEFSVGGRAKVECKMSDVWRSSLTLMYEKADQRAYPYYEYDAEAGKATSFAADAPGSYERDLFSAGLLFQRNDEKTLFTSSTSFQLLNDEMCLDQDFSADTVLSLRQQQRQRNVTQEFTFRSNHARKYQWVNGFFAFYKRNNVDSPMTLYASGFRKLVPDMPPFVKVTSDINIPGEFSLPAYGVALYHQSSYTFFGKLTATLGLRLDYEHTRFDYRTYADLNVSASFGGMTIPVARRYVIDDSEQDDYFEVLPKFALNFAPSDKCNLFASVAKGYKAGGYNYTMFSNIFQQQMQDVRNSLTKPGDETLDARGAVSYKPEYTWNYEVGVHANVLPGRFSLSASAFLVRLADQQIITYVSNGSRTVSNAAKSQNCGAEFSLAYSLRNVSVQLSYGYLHAVLKKYVAAGEEYAGNFLPFAPGHTLSLNASYTLYVCTAVLERIVFAAQYTAAGKIYFSEKNDFRQRYYGVLNGNISLCRKNMELSGWIKNATNEHYYTFYCESVGRRFVQKGLPVQAGVTFSVHY